MLISPCGSVTAFEIRGALGATKPLATDGASPDRFDFYSAVQRPIAKRVIAITGGISTVRVASPMLQRRLA